MMLYIARTHEFQIASHPYLDWCFGCGYEIRHKRQDCISPLQSCASLWWGGV